MAQFEYKNAKISFIQLQDYTSKYFSLLNTLEDLYKYGFISNISSVKDKIHNQIEINNNLIKQNKEITDKYE